MVRNGLRGDFWNFERVMMSREICKDREVRSLHER